MSILNDFTTINEKAKADFQRKQFSQAIAGFRSCLDLLGENGSTLDIAETRNNLGVCLVRVGDFQAALQTVLGTETIFAQSNNTQKQGIALANIASAYEGLKEYDQAAPFYEQAIECFNQCGDKKLTSITLHALSDLQLKSGKQYQAIGTLQAAYLAKPQANFKDKFFTSALGKVIQKFFGN